MSSIALTDREQQIFTLAGETYRYQGARETKAWKLLELTPTAFYQQANGLIDRETLTPEIRSS